MRRRQDLKIPPRQNCSETNLPLVVMLSKHSSEMKLSAMEPPPPMIRCAVPKKRNSPWNHVGRIFITGLLTVLPVIATLYFVLWVLSILEQFFGKQVLLLIPDQWYHTGMGLVVAIVVVFVVGILMHALLFR